MDLFRFFHPHHNPRLRAVAIRLQEIIELRSGAVEMGHAIDSALRREVDSERLHRVKSLLTEIVEELDKIADEHPGDSYNTLLQMMKERRRSPGWENWVSLLESSLLLIEKLPEKKLGNG